MPTPWTGFAAERPAREFCNEPSLQSSERSEWGRSVACRSLCAGAARTSSSSHRLTRCEVLDAVEQHDGIKEKQLNTAALLHFASKKCTPAGEVRSHALQHLLVAVRWHLRLVKRRGGRARASLFQETTPPTRAA